MRSGLRMHRLAGREVSSGKRVSQEIALREAMRVRIPPGQLSRNRNRPSHGPVVKLDITSVYEAEDRGSNPLGATTHLFARSSPPGGGAILTSSLRWVRFPGSALAALPSTNGQVASVRRRPYRFDSCRKHHALLSISDWNGYRSSKPVVAGSSPAESARRCAHRVRAGPISLAPRVRLPPQRLLATLFCERVEMGVHSRQRSSWCVDIAARVERRIEQYVRDLLGGLHVR